MDPSSFDAAIVDPTLKLLAALHLNEQQNCTRNVAGMDTDQIMDVPDTPDRFASQMINKPPDSTENRDLLARGFMNEQKCNQALNFNYGNSKRLYSNPLTGVRIIDESKPLTSNGSRKSDRDQFRIAKYEKRVSKKLDTKPCARTQIVEPSTSHGSPDITEIALDGKIQSKSNGKMINVHHPWRPKHFCSIGSRDSGRKMLSGTGGGSTTAKDMSTDVFDFKTRFEEPRRTEKACSYGTSKNRVARENGIGPVIADGTHIEPCRKTEQAADSSLFPHSIATFDKASIKAHKRENDGVPQHGVGTSEDYAKLTSGLKARGNNKGLDLPIDCLPKNMQYGSKIVQSVTPPRRTGQRRLVRNGVISPYNIAKGIRSSEDKGKNLAIDKHDGNEKMACNNPSNGSSPCSENNQNDRLKGKGLMYSMHGNEYDGQTKYLSSRSVEDTSDRASKHNFPKKTSFPSTHVAESYDNIGSTVGVGAYQGTTEDGDHASWEPISFRHTGPNEHFVYISSSGGTSGSDSGREKPGGDQKLIKRQRKYTSSHNSDGGSTSAVDEADISFIQLPGKSSNSGAIRTCSSQRHSRLGPVTEVDELCSFETRSNNFQGADCMVSDDSSARIRQVEADEELARELQDQFYNESPEGGGEEIDASLAWRLQDEEDVHATSIGNSHLLPHTRDSSLDHLYQYRTQSFPNSSVRSTSIAQVPTPSRLAQLRRTFRGRPPNASSRMRSFHFPSNMSLEMRLHLLEILEAANNARERTGHFHQLHRDFNENEYEILLALDEDNHHHTGASFDQINRLPVSKVKTDNYEEACTICLEIPSTGDTIRHLPCLHKFHKECIDPWLQRRKTCPICKSGIT